MAKRRNRPVRKSSSVSKSTTTPSNVQRSEPVETTTAHSPDLENAPLLSPVVPRRPQSPNSTPGFSANLPYSAGEPSSQFDAQINPAAVVTSFESQASTLQPIREPSFYSQVEISRDDVSETSESSAASTSEGDIEDQEEALSVTDITVFDEAIVIVEETPRGKDESFRDYAARRGESFGYRNLREQQVEVLEKLIEQKLDVMLIAKTSFGKSLIFQLAPLLTPVPQEPGIVLILMPLTLLQQNQAENVQKRGAHMGVRCIVLDQDTNSPKARQLIADGHYTHVFTSPEHVNEETFRVQVVNALQFQQKLICVAIDEAHLVEEWKDFREEYTRIGYFRQGLPRDVPFFAASATLSPRVREKVRRSCNFRPDSHLTETSIDREEIFVGVYPMERAQNSFLDLSGILPGSVETGMDIPKTVIFIDDIREIRAMRIALLNWMQKLGYPSSKFPQWVKCYFAGMAPSSKNSIAEDFGTVSAITEGIVSPTCRILIATTAYGLGIDNPDIVQIILWGLPRSTADAMQRLGRAMRNGKGQAVGCIFVPKWCVGPKKEDNKGKSTLSQSQSVGEPDVSDDGDLSDGNSVVHEETKSRLKPHVRREQMEEGLNQLVNGPVGNCHREHLLQEMGDKTYPSKEKPDQCCSGCQPHLHLLPVNETLVPAKSPKRNQALLIFIELQLVEWRMAEINSEPADSIYRLVPATFMPDEVIKAITLRHASILEGPDGAESVEHIREACQNWAEGDLYSIKIRDWLEYRMADFTRPEWRDKVNTRKWQDKKPKQVKKSAAVLEREEQRRQKQQDLALNHKSKRGNEAGSQRKTRVERLGGKPPSQQTTSKPVSTQRQPTRSKADEAKLQPKEDERVTNQRKRSTTDMALSPRKDNLKRAKSPNPPVPLSPTQPALARPSIPTPLMSASCSTVLTSDGNSRAASPVAAYTTSRAGRTQSPSAKKAYNSRNP